MLDYQAVPQPIVEKWWQSPLAVGLCVVSGAGGGYLTGPVGAGLWRLLTFTPRGPITPMGFTMLLFMSLLGGAVGLTIIASAAEVSKQKRAQWAAVVATMLWAIPVSGLPAFFAIVWVRGIPLGG